MFRNFGDYVKAIAYLEKALAITIEIDDRHGEESHYGDLGTMFISPGDRAQAYLEKVLEIAVQIGDRPGKARLQLNLGALLLSSGTKFSDANKYFEEALLIATETGDMKCQTICYKCLGELFQRLGDAVKAKEHHEKALAISVKCGERVSEAAVYANLGNLCITKVTILKLKNFSRRHFQ